MDRSLFEMQDQERRRDFEVSDIFLILKDHYRSGPVPISQMASCIYTKMPWFVKIGDGLYRNTLGDHYGEPFPKRVVINGKIEYVFDSAVKNPRRKGTLN